MKTSEAHSKHDKFAIFAYVDEVLAYFSMALGGSIALHGAFLFELPTLEIWTRWLGAGTTFVALCGSIAIAILLRNMRRRSWTPHDTLLLSVLAMLSLGWYCALVGLAHSVKVTNSGHEQADTSFASSGQPCLAVSHYARPSRSI